MLDAGASVELDSASVQGAGRAEQLHNGSFGQQPAQWYPTAKVNFFAGHIDMLYLEMQRTWPDGTGRIFLMISFSFWNLCAGTGRRLVTALFLAAFLASTMSVGLFSSVMDVPRVALLLLAVCSTKPNHETKVSG